MWLKELMRGFCEEPDSIAVAGYVGTGPGLPLFATLIGVELEERYKHFPKYISRSPTMNLCVRTEAARTVRFDESLPVAIETDFGYRFTARGRMLYAPAAVVRHYPRTSWRSFFSQQVGFARGAFQVYLKHTARLKGDHISTPAMISQIPLFCLACLALTATAASPLFLWVSALLFMILLGMYIRDTMKLRIPLTHYPMMIGIFTVRTVGWVAGVLEGVCAWLLGWCRCAKWRR
jgi:GT2 family glycosyltransferase